MTHQHSHDDHHDHTHDHGHSHASNAFMVELMDKKEVAEGTMAFYFKRPPGLEFKAGQHANWILIDPPETDAEGNSRMFSLANSPSENFLMIATRMRDTAFKRVLKQLPIGSKIAMENPHGSFTLHRDLAKPAVFLIGGIGITPVFSIIKDARERKLSQSMFLFYSNRRPEDAAFLHELQELANDNNYFTFIPTMTEPEKSAQSWRGETGYIDQPMVKRHLKDIHAAIYYLSGPLAMVSAMRKLLNEAGIDDDNIKTEEFTGY